METSRTKRPTTKIDGLISCQVWMSPVLRKAVKQAALEADKGLSEFIVDLLERHVPGRTAKNGKPASN